MYRPEPNLGELRSVHRPIAWRFLFLAMISLAPLFLIGLGILILINDSVNGRDVSFNKVIGPIGCLGAIALITALLIGLLVSEFRKWYRTRSVRLKVFERGFTYEEHDRLQVCAWNEIKDITYRKFKIHRWHTASRRISVIRSIVKADGTEIVLAETLNLPKIASLITAGKSSAEPRIVGPDLPKPWF